MSVGKTHLGLDMAERKQSKINPLDEKRWVKEKEKVFEN